MLKILKSPRTNKFCFYNFKLCFSYSVIVRTSFCTKRAANLEFFQKIINQIIFKFTSTVRMKNADIL